MKIYLDRNIFGEIKKLKDNSDLANRFSLLRNAVDENRITILLSTTILEETLPVLNHSPNMLKDELKVIFSLVKEHRMIKLPDDLLREAVQSYAFARRLPDMLTKTPRIFKNFLVEGEVSQNLREAVKEKAAQNSEFTDDLTNAFSKARCIGEKRNVGSPENFQEFWNAATPAIIEGIAKQHSVYDRCLERGLKGLLEVKTIRLYTIYYAAWAYAKWFGEQGTPGKVKPSEKGDFFHSVQSAAADVFVTNDKKLARWLKQIFVNDFEIICFEQLFERLCDKG